MYQLSIAFFLVLLVSCQESTVDKNVQTKFERPQYALVIHGGAGGMKKEHMDDVTESQYKNSLNAALDIGQRILEQGGTSLDAVEQVIRSMENDTMFNAGKGAVYTNHKTNELDASIMDGSNRNAGAVGGVTTIKNPISAARAVMENSEHVFMAREGAEEFAREHGLDLVDPSYFYTKRSMDRIESILRQENEKEKMEPVDKHGTVGVVALDNEGNLAAGTSTGGMTNKKWGRIGDSPIIGAGTFADNNTCAVSCTGHGEFFIRWAVAYDLAAQMEYLGIPLEAAAKNIIQDKLNAVGGAGGLIALDKHGNVTMEYNTASMYRGYVKPNQRYVGIFQD